MLMILVGCITDFLEDLVLLDFFFNSVGAKEKELASHENQTLQLTKDRKT